STAAQRSTHFDDVRLEWTPAPVNQPPSVTLTAPADGSTVDAGAPVTLEASAADADGAVVDVRFFVDGAPVAVDDAAPFTAAWTPPTGSTATYQLHAEAEDDAGAVSISAAVTVTAVPPATGGSLTVVNPSFEQPALADGAVRDNTGVPGWTFSGTPGTFRGVFNPPAGSYPEAAGQGTPIGADGAQVAFLFNNAGAGESVDVRQDLAETLVAGRDYTLRVAVGAFDPSQPYPPSSFGGYRLELLAGSTVIASAAGVDAPPMATFTEVTATALGVEIDPALAGELMSVRLSLPGEEARRSTHFDRVRVDWVLSNAAPTVAWTSPADGALLDLPAGDTVPLLAAAADADGNLAEVRFYSDGALIGAAAAAPFGVDWLPGGPGLYALRAEAVDTRGEVSSTAPVWVAVRRP
ncbi:MAG: Ig-like domain-containing protein, partial [Acidobacteriota bacterium]